MREAKRFYVYIMTNGPRSHVLYTGVTGDLLRRVFEHKNKLVPGFTSRYNLTRLVYHEVFAYRTWRLIVRMRSRVGVAARRFGSLSS
jgi:predicted GIY-YIG superfamily endonuclease